MTREALAADMRALAPDGLLLLNITNRFVDLEPVLATAVAQAGWAAALRDEDPRPRAGLIDKRSIWVVVARNPAALAGALAAMPPGEWRPLREAPHFRAWTDDYTSVVPLLKRPTP